MSVQIQWRRGTSSQHSTFTGVSGEVTVDTSYNTVRVHDGATAGGWPLVGALISNPYALTIANTAQTTSLGVGTAPSGVSGEIRAANNITAYYSSDIKFKENIQEIENPIEKVVHIGGKTFDWTDEFLKDHGGADDYFLPKNSFGVIAQDVQEVFPLAVRTRPDGSLAVDYEKLCVLALAAIKEQQKQIDTLMTLVNNK